MLISNENELKAFSEEREQVEARMKGVSKIDAELRAKLEAATFLVGSDVSDAVDFWTRSGHCCSVKVAQYSLDFISETVCVDFDKVNTINNEHTYTTILVPFRFMYMSEDELRIRAKERKAALEAEARKVRYCEYMRLKEEFESEESV